MGCNDNGRTAVVGDELHLAGCQHDIDRIDHGTGFECAIVTDHPFPAIAGIQRHTIARPNAKTNQGIGKAIRQHIQFGKAKGAFRAYQRWLVAILMRRPNGYGPY